MSSAVAVLYGLHLTMIAGLNALLSELLAATFPLLVFIPGTVVAAFEPHYATWFWLIAFFALLVRRLASRSDAT